MTPKTLPPPRGCPGPGERLPIATNAELRRVIRKAAGVKLTRGALDRICYLVRKAHGQGLLDGGNDGN